MKKRPARLSRASAYFRLAAKSDRHGDPRQADIYRGIAERLVKEHQRETTNKGASNVPKPKEIHRSHSAD